MLNKNIIGMGWRLAPVIDKRGGIGLVSNELAVEQSIRFILGTAPGERIMRPDFGCRIHDLVFAPNNTHTCNLAAHYVQEALLKWEPRIEEIRVEAGTDEFNDAAILIHLEYKIRQTNSFFNLVYPFYLEQGEKDTRSQLGVE